GTTLSGVAVSPNLIVATTLATLTYMLVSSHLVNTYIHLEHGVPWDKNWWGDDRWEILLIIVLSPLAVLMASRYRTRGQPRRLRPQLGAAAGPTLAADTGPLSLLPRADRPLRLDPSAGQDHLPAEWHEFRSLLAAPIVSHQGPVGLLCLLHRERNAFTANQEQ